MPAEKTIPLIEFDKVGYGVNQTTVLENVSFEVLPGRAVGLLGKNGAGKTTVIELIAQLLTPSSGKVLWQGKPTNKGNRAKLRRHIGLVPQQTALYNELNALQNIHFYADLYGLKAWRQRAAEVLEVVGLSAAAGQTVGTYSGGMRRRLAIARALLHDPDFLVLDEPTTGVDAEGREHIWQYIEQLVNHGKTLFICTNYLDEVDALCDRVLVLQDGTISVDTTPALLAKRIGYQLEVTCSAAESKALEEKLDAQPGVAKVVSHELGLTVYLKNPDEAQAVMQVITASGKISGLRYRAPEMAEILNAAKV